MAVGTIRAHHSLINSWAPLLHEIYRSARYPGPLVLGDDLEAARPRDHPLEHGHIVRSRHLPAEPSRRDVVPSNELARLLAQLSTDEPIGLMRSAFARWLPVPRDLGDDAPAELAVDRDLRHIRRQPSRVLYGEPYPMMALVPDCLGPELSDLQFWRAERLPNDPIAERG